MSVDIFALIAEERIREAIADGTFDHFPGKGKPLELEDLSHIPEVLRAGYKLLKNAGYIPPELQLTKEIVSLQELISLCASEEEQLPLRQQLNEKQLRYRLLLESQGISGTAAFAQYEQQIRNKLEGDE
ncbi:DnaJ family domain-containing protein [Paenibacillus sp. GCM10027626]|uniref:DnaJ family domain-containing protein n=1 Tax=Paenibacillus sp. GCM10027626 TaxID=3273411 RepID=UPI00362F288C